MTFIKEVNAIGLMPEKLEVRASRKRVSLLRMNKIKHGPAPKTFLSVRQGAEPRQAGCRRILGSSCVRHSPMGGGKWDRHRCGHSPSAEGGTALPWPALHSHKCVTAEKTSLEKKRSMWPRLFLMRSISCK